MEHSLCLLFYIYQLTINIKGNFKKLVCYILKKKKIYIIKGIHHMFYIFFIRYVYAQILLLKYENNCIIL